MNLFIRELKSNFKSFCLWVLALIFLIATSAGKTSGIIHDSNTSLQDMLEQLPKSIQTVFGVGVVDYSSAIGIFAIVLLYIALIMAFHASSLGVGVFAKEERDKTFEFLYTKGRTRQWILCVKVIASLLQMLVLNVICYASSVLMVQSILGESIAMEFLPMMAGVFVIQLTFYSIGLLCSFLTTRMKLAGSISSAVVMVCFFSSILSDFGGGFGWLSYLSPFKYFDGKELIHTGIEPQYVLVCITVIVICTAVSFWKHGKRDLHT